MTVAILIPHIGEVLLWGLVATILMTTLLEGAQFLGFSRMSLPFLFGTVVTADRTWAMIWGYILYVIGGWFFAFLYAVMFDAVGMATVWLGGLIGFLHGLFLITVFLPNLPYIHPRMATIYDGPSPLRMLEPPGPWGLNYGHQTPLATLLAQTMFGLLLGLAYRV